MAYGAWPVAAEVRRAEQVRASGHGGVYVGVNEAFEFGLSGAFDVAAAAGSLELPEIVEGFVEGSARGGFVAGEGGEGFFGALESLGEAWLVAYGVWLVVSFDVLHLLCEEIGFNAGDAVELPLGLGELSDEEYFRGSGGVVLFEEGVQKVLVFVRVFTG
ncbi:MAG TPA: hypothetical protein VN428_15730 [Bryobacteraceae bacterium]|nr:hypothetical protein [Bryobacteraceae bacterium]